MQLTKFLVSLSIGTAIVSAAVLPKAKDTSIDVTKSPDYAPITAHTTRANTFLEEQDTANVKRTALPEAEADPRWCGRVGEPCWVKVKRDPIPEAKPEAKADARWCGRVGEPCW